MTLRLIADDLTGALDTAAEFIGMFESIPVFWTRGLPPDLPGRAALDSGTRELSEAEAVATASELAPALAGGTIAYKKVDSLMRGHAIAELAACFRSGLWQHCVFAPAFPHQLRITRGRHQLARQGDRWEPVSGDLVADLQATGLSVQPGDFAGELAAGISIFDAETQEDLDRIADRARGAAGRVLWCGSGGLARALARGSHVQPSTAIHLPVLGLFGSDQAITESQLAACGSFRIDLPDGDAVSVTRVEEQLDSVGVALASFRLPAGLSRREAAERIGSHMGALTRHLMAPRTLIVSGGETLRALCLSLGAHSLEVRGYIESGVPRSVLRGGRWDGVEVVSKSGAFGRPELWRDLLGRNGLRPRE
jgi:uncharacterized protein YgbK (DUF1537 family)